ncbi:MAG: M28 family peptidase, partial [Acidobacteria bacterium]|nr:M28 family peptidase [Acidobacteriota bacterium]
MLAHFGWRIVPGIALLALASACGGSGAAPERGGAGLDGPDVQAGLNAIDGDRIRQHMATLADDALEGRGLGTPGYEGALHYVETTLKSLGVEPAGEGGGFRQRVPLRNSTVVEDASSMKVTSRAGTKTLAYGVDFLLGGDHLREQVTVENAPVAFVGYGVSAPALGYDDYASAGSLEGKVVAYLSGAPPSLPSNERAHFSSGAVKDAEAARRGAVGTVSFTSPDDPRFRWDVSVATSQQGSFAWIDAEGQPSRGDLTLGGSVSLNHSGAAALFAGAPTPLTEVFAAAAASRPQAFDLPTRISLTTRTTHRDIESANLVGRVAGSDPQLQAEHVVYVAHVDHFGRGVPVNGDDIYNGAHDNASGVAIVLEVARAFTTLPVRPRRSALFLFVTAEERGLLGSDYFVRHPTVPRDSLVADLA